MDSPHVHARPGQMDTWLLPGPAAGPCLRDAHAHRVRKSVLTQIQDPEASGPPRTPRLAGLLLQGKQACLREALPTAPRGQWRSVCCPRVHDQGEAQGSSVTPPHRRGGGCQTKSRPQSSSTCTDLPRVTCSFQPVHGQPVHGPPVHGPTSPQASRSTKPEPVRGPACPQTSQATDQNPSRRCRAALGRRKHAGPRSPLSFKTHNARSRNRSLNKAKNTDFLVAQPSQTGLINAQCRWGTTRAQCAAPARSGEGARDTATASDGHSDVGVRLTFS